jgi:hypothetical protein
VRVRVCAGTSKRERVANDLEVHGSSIFRVEVCRMGEFLCVIKIHTLSRIT